MYQPNTAPTAALYTELPYPDDGVIRTTGARILRAVLEQHRPDLLRRRKLRIADIGCGTGEVAAGMARWFPDAELFAVDINPPSLEKARALADRHGLSIGFVQADIAVDLADRLGAAGALEERRVDIVVSLGVLHHLSDPSDGFRQLRKIVADDGLLLCYMYSAYGKREEIAVKKFLSEAIGPDVRFEDRVRMVQRLGIDNRHTWGAFLRGLKNRWRFGPPLVISELVKSQLRRNRFARQSDTFLNPCEHLYAFREINQLCEQTGWKILGLSEQGGLPTSPHAHTKNRARLEVLRELPPDVLYDYFALYYRASGFSFYAKPV